MPVCLFCSTQEAESFLGFGYRKKKRPHSQAFLQCGFFIFPSKTFSFVKNFLATPWGMWDLSFQPGFKPVPSALESRSLNHWAAREVPKTFSFLK